MKNKRVIWTTILGTVVCLVIAALFFGIKFNDFQRAPIYFLILGFAGSVSLALFREKQLRDVIYINIIIYFLFVIGLTFLRPITTKSFHSPADFSGVDQYIFHYSNFHSRITVHQQILLRIFTAVHAHRILGWSGNWNRE